MQAAEREKSRPLPPPPPPRDTDTVPTEQSDQSFAFSALRELGYPVESVSPWKLVTDLLKDVVTLRENSKVSEDKVLKLERDKREILKEFAKKIKEIAEEKRNDRRVEVLQDALFDKGDASSRALAEVVARNKKLEVELKRARASLVECQTECQRLASVATFVTASKENVVGDLEAHQRAFSETEKLIQRLNSLLEEEKSSKQKLVDELEHLRLDMIKMDGVREGLVHKLERAQTNAGLEQEAKKKLEETLQKSREETQRTAELLIEEKRSRKSIKARLDEVEKELSQTRSELSQKEKKTIAMEKAKLELEQQLGVLRRQVGAQSEVLSTREDELRHALKKAESLEQELDEEKKSHSLRLHEVRAAALDISTMTRENRELTHAYEKIQREMREVKAQLEESRTKHKRLAGMLDAAKVERAELIGLYKKVCDEHARIAEELKGTSASKAELIREERVASDSAAELQRKVGEVEVVLRKQEVELQNYDRRVEGLTRELRACRAKCESLEEGKTLAERANGNEQQRYAQAVRQYDSIKWELEQTKTELGSCATRLERALEENARLAEQLVGERIKIGELESQVERARIGQAKALISSGQAFTSTTERLRSPPPERTPVAPQSGLSAARMGGHPPPSAIPPEEEDALSSSRSTMKDFDDRFEELERVMGDDLSEASSVIRQTREERHRRGTPGGFVGSGQRQSPPFTST